MSHVFMRRRKKIKYTCTKCDDAKGWKHLFVNGNLGQFYVFWFDANMRDKLAKLTLQVASLLGPQKRCQVAQTKEICLSYITNFHLDAIYSDNELTATPGWNYKQV